MEVKESGELHHNRVFLCRSSRRSCNPSETSTSLARSDAALYSKSTEMRAIILLIIICTGITALRAQTSSTISGSVKKHNGQPIPGVNVLLAGSYDGGSTDSSGHFSFTTSEAGPALLLFTALGYRKDSLRIEVNGSPLDLTLKMKEEAIELNAVTISAGVLETGDSKKGSVLSSLDVATTAGAVADIVAALQTLPGTAQAFGENGLFVRGGTGSETQTYFDGMMVRNAYGSQLPDLSSRSRFSPFLFKGTSFSSGGYSAQYGQALSSALLMESKDQPDKSSSEFSLMSVGVSAAHTSKFQKSSLVVGGNYYNLAPAYAILNQNIDWVKAPTESQASIQYKYQPGKTGILKVYAQFNNSTARLRSEFGDDQKPALIDNRNSNYYFNSTYQDKIGEWKINAGLSGNRNIEYGKIDLDNYQFRNEFAQARLVVSRYFLGHNLFRAGTEHAYNSHLESWNEQSREFSNQMQAAFAETEWYIGSTIVARTGVRSEYNSVMDAWNLAPRASVAIKTGRRGQVALAYGTFYQNPDDTYLVQDQHLDYEKANHFILNYQYQTTGITFRAEGYYKKYNSLVKYDLLGFVRNFGVVNFSNLRNDGDGFAKGFDLFFKDKRSIPGGQYYISYSYLDTRRNFRNYPVSAMPPFAAKHSLNVVYKQYIPQIKTEIGTTYTFSSGRTYYNPNNAEFLGDRTRNFNNLSVNISYLTHIRGEFAVLYVSATNIPGFRNVYGYNYSNDGAVSTAIYPAATRNIFAGLLVTIGDNTFNH